MPCSNSYRNEQCEHGSFLCSPNRKEQQFLRLKKICENFLFCKDFRYRYHIVEKLRRVRNVQNRFLEARWISFGWILEWNLEILGIIIFEDERLEGKFSGKKLCSPWRNGGAFQTLHLPMITIRWMERITFSKHRRLFEFPTSVLCFSTETNPRTRFFLARTICLESKIKSDMLSSEQFLI